MADHNQSYDLSEKMVSLWQAFQYDVSVETDSLLYVLEAIHMKHLEEQERLAKAASKSGCTFEDALNAPGASRHQPMYPKLRGFPMVEGEPLFKRSAPDGPMEHAAIKGWVAQVYDLWESHYRTQLYGLTRELPGSIRHRQQVLGDLRHIRNNLLHKGIATKDEVGKCKILRWFSVGEQMQMRLRHVIDFLNQMVWLYPGSVTVVGPRRISCWVIVKEGDLEHPTPALVSVRPLFHPEEPDPRYRYSASVAFENFVFGLIPMGPENEENEAQAKYRNEKWKKMKIDKKGNLFVPSLGPSVSATRLYRNCLGEESAKRADMWSPPIQIRE